MLLHEMLCKAQQTLSVDELSWVELSLNICIQRRTRWSVTTAPDDGSQVLEN